MATLTQRQLDELRAASEAEAAELRVAAIALADHPSAPKAAQIEAHVREREEHWRRRREEIIRGRLMKSPPYPPGARN